ncbi:MAG: hypothetical protein LBD44_06920 [Spirochaetaceae bacterium]|jgi:hypothetical protein|nr:hypothetical protein [Spirochaetaceae bacterium]
MALSTGAFRSIEQWKTAIITLPDTHFFDLIRSILGNIQSPFNKQRLLDDLAAFLSNKDVQKTIAAYIDEDDHKMIAAISVLNEPDRRELAAFFSGEYSYTKIASLVINLEERLIVYGIKESGQLSLNPLLKKVLLPFAADTKILFPYIKAVDTTQRASVFDDLYLASFITLIAPEKHTVRGDGALRKNLLRKIQKIFPVKGAGADVFMAALRCLGLLMEDTFNYSGQKLQDFAHLTESERFVYCAAGFYISLTEEAEKSPLPQKNRIQHIASIAVSLLDSLDGDNIYPASTLSRLFDIKQKVQAGVRGIGSEVDANKPLKSAALIEAIEKTGLLVKTADGYQKRIYDNGKNTARTGDARFPVIAFNSLFSFVLLPEITFQDIVSLAPFCEVADANRPVQFKLTQMSAVRGFNSGISGKTIFEILKKFSAARIDAGLEATLDDWEKRHSEVVIIEGIGIVLSEGRRYITETEPLASHIVLNPSPGVYLLDFTEKDEAAAALKKAGVEIVSEPRLSAKPASPLQRKPSPFFVSISHQTASLSGPENRQLLQTNSAQTDGCVYSSAEEYKNRFRTMLDGLNPSKLEREELAARIDRKLVISPTQLNGAFIRYERREVHGLDYAGKLALVKQALLSNETLEIIIQNSDGTEKYITGIPLTLVKTGDETVLSVKLPEDDGEFDDSTGESGCIKISMGKIRTVKRIKRSIFAKESR